MADLRKKPYRKRAYNQIISIQVDDMLIQDISELTKKFGLNKSVILRELLKLSIKKAIEVEHLYELK